jgi:hypothetical protein
MAEQKKADQKRRLPVLQPGEPETVRPPWQWALIGAALGILILFPLVELAQLVLAHETRRLAPGESPEATAEALRVLGAGARAWLQIAAVLGNLLPLAIAAFFGGALVGRFGAQAGAREATWSGLGVGVFVTLLGAPTMLRAGEITAWIVAALLFVGLGGLMGRLGCRVGLRRRP